MDCHFPVARTAVGRKEAAPLCGAFVDQERSYASFRGEPENMAVIGLAAFEERILDPQPSLERRDATPDPRGPRTEVGDIGTEYGRDMDSRLLCAVCSQRPPTS